MPSFKLCSPTLRRMLLSLPCPQYYADETTTRRAALQAATPVE